jgi:hypothetical protein
MPTPLITDLTSAIGRAHVTAHIAFLTDATDAIALGRGKIWLEQFPSNPGVYCIFEGKALIYAGETGSLKGRMRDLLDTRNHTFRREIGKAKFGARLDYRPASSKVKVPDEIERLLTDFMLRQLKVKAAPVVLGRKELEERLIDEKKPKYNTKTRRGDAFDEPGL